MHRSEGRGDRRRRRERRIVGLAFFLLTDIQDRHEIREIRTGEDAMRRTGIFSRLAMVAGALLLSGCPGPPAPSAAGTLSVRMVDAGLPGLAGVYVTVGHIDVHPQGGNWKTVLIPQTTVNLLELVNGVQVNLGLTDLAAGPYTELRLVLGSIPDDTLNILAAPHPYANYLIDEAGRVQELTLPGGLQTGIKPAGGFSIASGRTTSLVLDFDAAHSLVRAGSSGGYLLKPAIKVRTGSTLTGEKGQALAQNDSF